MATHTVSGRRGLAALAANPNMQLLTDELLDVFSAVQLLGFVSTPQFCRQWAPVRHTDTDRQTKRKMDVAENEFHTLAHNVRVDVVACQKHAQELGKASRERWEFSLLLLVDAPGAPVGVIAGISWWGAFCLLLQFVHAWRNRVRGCRSYFDCLPDGIVGVNQPIQRTPLWPAAWLSAVVKSRSSGSVWVQRVWEVHDDRLQFMGALDAKMQYGGRKSLMLGWFGLVRR